MCRDESLMHVLQAAWAMWSPVPFNALERTRLHCWMVTFLVMDVANALYELSPVLGDVTFNGAMGARL
jgi:hypothetical protein